MSNYLQKICYQQLRYLPRWCARKPVRVIPPENIAEEKFPVTDEKTNKLVDKSNKNMFTKINWKQPGNETGSKDSKVHFKMHPKVEKPLTIKPLSKKKKVETTDMIETVIDAEGNFVYSKMGNNDKRIAAVLTEVKNMKEQLKKDLVLLEGKRIIKDALEAGCKLQYILFSRMNEVEYLKPYLPKLGAKLYKMPYREIQMWSDLTTSPGIMGIFRTPNIEDYDNSNSIPLTIICDNIRDPSNLGAILRGCSGVGCNKVLLTNGCVNIWDPKVLRSSAGAHFRLQIHQKVDWNSIKTKIPEDSNVFIADNKTCSSDLNVDSEELASILDKVPMIPYYGTDFKSAKHVVLVIGGETEGISVECYKTVEELKGSRLNIPLSNNVDSLNTGMALGIIAFEVKRQMLIK